MKRELRGDYKTYHALTSMNSAPDYPNITDFSKALLYNTFVSGVNLELLTSCHESYTCC